MESPTTVRTRTQSSATDSEKQSLGQADFSSSRLSLDLGVLLNGALRELVDVTGAVRAVGWALDASGAPFAAATIGDPSPPPDEATMLALGKLSGATDLGEPGIDPELRTLPALKAFHAAAPVMALTVRDQPSNPIAMLLLAFETKGPTHRAPVVRPRALAAMDLVAQRLHAPAAAAAAGDRLSELGDEMLRITRLATIGDLLSEVVHEIRNPLVSVKTFLQLLPDNLDDPDFHTNFRNVVIDEVRRMERLLETVLQQARPSTESETGAPMGLVIESVGRLLEKRAQEKDLKLTIDVGADLPNVAIAEDPLRQIVLNLALNAFEATPDGGSVRLSAMIGKEISEETAAKIGTDGAKGTVDFVVDDEGPGVPVEQRDRLFDPFFSTRQDRAGGLGLTVCLRIAEQAKGSVSVEESPGGGARFRVRLPIL